MIYFVVKFQSHQTLTVNIIIFIFQYYIALLLIAWRPATNLSWLFRTWTSSTITYHITHT